MMTLSAGADKSEWNGGVVHMARGPGKNYEIDMCSGPILPKLLQFTLPLMYSSVLQLLFNAADIIVVGRWAGDNSLAAVGSNASIIGLLTNLFIGLSVGANILAARYYGANEKEALRQSVHTAMLLALISGFLLALVGVCGARGILVLMQSPPEVIDLATLYLRIYFLGMPAPCSITSAPRCCGRWAIPGGPCTICLAPVW